MNRDRTEFNKFDGVVYGALQSINKKEAMKALKIAEIKAKKSPNPNKSRRESLYQEPILFSLNKNNNSVENII
jgi:hypothetical protein